MLARGNLPRHPSAMMRRITEHADEEIHSPRTPSPELYPNGQRPSAAVRVPRRNAGGFDLAASLIRLTSTATLRPAQSLAARFKVVATGGSTSSLGALLRKDGEGAEGPWMPVHLALFLNYVNKTAAIYPHPIDPSACIPRNQSRHCHRRKRGLARARLGESLAPSFSPMVCVAVAGHAHAARHPLPPKLPPLALRLALNPGDHESRWMRVARTYHGVKLQFGGGIVETTGDVPP